MDWDELKIRCMQEVMAVETDQEVFLRSVREE